MGGLVDVSSITDREDARAALEAALTPGNVRAVALRADDLRFQDPPAAVGVAEAVLEAQNRLPPRLRRPRLVALTWKVFGSACRAAARFDEAEVALLHAALVLPQSDTRNRAKVLRRLAYVRADQRRKEACELMATVVAFWRPQGGPELGQELVASATILARFGEDARAAADAEEALKLLPANGDRFHVSALYNLAASRLEISSTEAELEAVAGWIAEASRYVDPGSFPDLRLRWLTGKRLRRLRHYEAAIAAMEEARVGIDQRSNGYDRALLLVDLAEVHLEAGADERARQLALSSFSIMQALRNEPESLKALRLLHKAASDLSLDRAAVRTARATLLAARR